MNRKNFKKIIYISLTILLGIMVSFIVHAFIEIWFIKKIILEGIMPENSAFFGYGYCALPVMLKLTLLFTGIIGGFFVGERWWKIVYVGKRHWSYKNSKKKRK